MADLSPPGYELEETLPFQSPEQFRALFEDTRLRIVDLLAGTSSHGDRAGGGPGQAQRDGWAPRFVLEQAGLIRVVRTKKVRAIEAKYYGRTARTYLLSPKVDVDLVVSPDYFLTSAASEYAKAAHGEEELIHHTMISTLRYAADPKRTGKGVGAATR